MMSAIDGTIAIIEELRAENDLLEQENRRLKGQVRSAIELLETHVQIQGGTIRETKESASLHDHTLNIGRLEGLKGAMEILHKEFHDG